MRKLLVTAVLSLAPALALGGGHADVHVSLSANPTMAVVQPGVQVVVDQDDEIFYTDQEYWLRRGGGWYHARHHGDAFVYAEVGQVPSMLVGLPVRHYRHYHGGGMHDGYDGYDDGYGDHGGGGHGHGYGGGHGHGGGC